MYLVLLMTAFNWMSHGTQDIYPTFMKKGLGFSENTALYVAILYNIGALVGGTLMGAASERCGRRAIVVFCAVLGLPILPLFAASLTLGMVCLGTFLMQFVVEGAWGVIPAHLTELSPAEICGFYPGVTYQLGNCFAAFNLPIQQHLAETHSTPTRSSPPWSPCSSPSRCWLRSARKHAGSGSPAARYLPTGSLCSPNQSVSPAASRTA